MTLHRLEFLRAVALRAAACVVVLCLVAADTAEVPAPADGKSVAQKVREGLSHFYGGQFSEAKTSFGAANEMAPDNKLIRFDEACATLAAGDVDAARSLFQSVSLAKDTSLSIKAHYNLGCLEADLAKVKLGAERVEVEGDTREESIQLLMTSVRHYRDVLRLDRDHKDARYNIEVIRLFVKHIQSQWAERDKQRDREEKDLLQFILMLAEKETQIREDVRSLEDQDDSPQRRQLLREMAEGQRELQEEILPLKEKIEQALAPPEPQPGQPSASGTQQPLPQDGQSKEMLTAMTGMADDIGAKMLSAGDAMSSADFDGFEESQSEALHLLNQLYMIVAPYDNLLQRSLTDQQRLVPEEHIGDEETLNVAADVDAVEETVEETAAGMVKLKDVEDAVESQSRITDWTRLLPLKAEAALPQVKQQLDSLPPATDEPLGEVGEEGENTVVPTEPDDATATATPDKDDVQDPAVAAAEAQIKQQQKQRQQLEGLVASMELALELAPDAEQHSNQAVEYLVANEVELASPEQTETLRILNEIAEPLKNDEQDQQQQQNDDQSQDENGNQEQQQNESKDQQQNKDNKQEQEKQQKQQQAESLLRQARERERDYRKKLKEQQAIFGTGIKVDKDW